MEIYTLGECADVLRVGKNYYFLERKKMIEKVLDVIILLFKTYIPNNNTKDFY